jgi:hypothetical protein
MDVTDSWPPPPLSTITTEESVDGGPWTFLHDADSGSPVVFPLTGGPEVGHNLRLRFRWADAAFVPISYVSPPSNSILVA